MLQFSHCFLLGVTVRKKSFWILAVMGWCLAWSTLLFAGLMEVDSNFDGKTDQWHHVSASGQVDKVEYDLDYNGAVDQVQYFKSEKKTGTN